jgi:hypothetical protein
MGRGNCRTFQGEKEFSDIHVLMEVRVSGEKRLYSDYMDSQVLPVVVFILFLRIKECSP